MTNGPNRDARAEETRTSCWADDTVPRSSEEAARRMEDVAGDVRRGPRLLLLGRKPHRLLSRLGGYLHRMLRTSALLSMPRTMPTGQRIHSSLPHQIQT